MSARTIFIGDVHGCADELRDLLMACEAGPSDRLISVGDLISKGPASGEVAAWARATPNLEGVLGNHELRLLRHWRAGTRSAEKSHDADTYRQLGADYEATMEYFARWPMMIAGPGFLTVHAGFDPRVETASQAPETLATIRRLDDGRPWHEAYEGKSTVVFGHWARRGPVVRENAIGLDTGCVYGVALTALIWPERRLVSIPARRSYAVKRTWDEPVPASR